MPNPNSEYEAWSSMKQRCYNPNHKSYDAYGGCGITVCARWTNSFDNFFADMGPRPTPQHSIDRKDGTGNYTPDNCRWATKQEQRENQARIRLLTHDGETHSIAEWARIIGIRLDTLLMRLDRQHWPIEKALVKIDARRAKIARPNCPYCGKEMTVHNASNLHFRCRSCGRYHRAQSHSAPSP